MSKVNTIRDLFSDLEDENSAAVNELKGEVKNENPTVSKAVPNSSAISLTDLIEDDVDGDSKKEREIIEKKIKKIALLTKQVDTLENQVNEIKVLYASVLGSEKEALFLNKEKLIIKLYDRFQQKTFSNWQKELILTKIFNEINFLVDNDRLTDKVSEIHKEITSLQQEEMGEDEKEYMNEMAKEMFKNMGVEIDEDTFNFADFANQEFRDDFAKNFHKENAEAQEEERLEKKREKVRTTDKEFQKLYRLLVKKTHPDLVKGVHEKELREDLMKRLSKAWEDRNYYQLLILQNEIDAGTSFELSLSKKQLKAMAIQLNEEIKGIEAIKYHLKKIDAESSFYYQNFYARSEKGILKKIEAYKKIIVMDSIQTKEDLEDLKTQKSTKELLNAIKERSNFFEDSVFGDFFG